VLLCSYRGERYLARQLDSIAAQTLPATLFVHDDASDDGTLDILTQHPLSPSVVAHADNVGIVRNIERGLRQLHAAGHRHVALADQDDVWHPRRLEACVREMQLLEARLGAHTPLLVHSDLRMIDATGRELAPSFVRYRGYATSASRSVAVMLGQSGVMGNTCLLNRALIELAHPFPTGLHVHDWWLGLMAELYGARGFVNEALVDYRIHRDNVSNSVGALDGGAGPPTLGKLLRRDFRVPFMEDGRRQVLQALLLGDGHRPVPRGADRDTLEDFVACLGLPEARWRSTSRLIRGGFARPGRRHRLRLVAAALTTARYDRR